MERIICIAAPVAGSGRTTAAVNLAAAFAAFELKTLLVDCDPQNRCLCSAVIDPPANAPGLSQILSGRVAARNCCIQTRLDYLKILPAGENLLQTIANPALMPVYPRSFENLTGIDKSNWDMIILDSSAVFSPMVQWAASASDVLITMIRLEMQSSESVSDIFRNHRNMLKNIVELRKKNTEKHQTAAILINGCDDAQEAEAILGPDLFGQVSGFFMPVCIPDDQRLYEAMVFGKPVVCHDIGSAGARAFLKLAETFSRIPGKSVADTGEQFT